MIQQPAGANPDAAPVDGVVDIPGGDMRGIAEVEQPIAEEKAEEPPMPPVEEKKEENAPATIRTPLLSRNMNLIHLIQHSTAETSHPQAHLDIELGAVYMVEDFMDDPKTI